MAVSHSASALGEAIGKIIEDEIESLLRPVCEKEKYIYDRGGARLEKRRGVKLSMVNKSGNEYQLDGVIETPDKMPIVLLESKYLRYTKHNRDKASWTCASHYSLRKSHPTIRKSIAVISGNWSIPSKKFLQSFGIELHEVSFDSMCKALSEYHIKFDWNEKDQKTPRKSLALFEKLSTKDKQAIGQKLLRPIANDLKNSIRLTLQGGEDWAKRVKEIEILLKTERNEYFTYSFSSARDAIKYLLSLQEDSPDLRGKL